MAESRIFMDRAGAGFSVTVQAAGDAAGITSPQAAAGSLPAQGLAVRIIYPIDGHKDFNAELAAETIA